LIFGDVDSGDVNFGDVGVRVRGVGGCGCIDVSEWSGLWVNWCRSVWLYGRGGIFRVFFGI